MQAQANLHARWGDAEACSLPRALQPQPRCFQLRAQSPTNNLQLNTHSQTNSAWDDARHTSLLRRHPPTTSVVRNRACASHPTQHLPAPSHLCTLTSSHALLSAAGWLLLLNTMTPMMSAPSVTQPATSHQNSFDSAAFLPPELPPGGPPSTPAAWAWL